MWKLAMRNLWTEPGRLVGSLGGVAASMLLVLVLDGAFAGASEQLVAYPANAGADVWVMQDGVTNMHMATSRLSGDAARRVEAVDGVREVVPLLYVNTFVDIGDSQWFSYVVGVPPGASMGGPWDLAAGERFPGEGEVVIPERLAADTGVGLGDRVRVGGRPLTVVGLSRGTYSMANSVAFASPSFLRSLLATSDGASYLLVGAQDGVDAAELARRIREAVPTVNATTRDAFVESDRRMAMQMGVDIVGAMTFIGFVVAVLIIGLTAYTATLRRAKEYGILKALGARTRSLLGLVLLQTSVLALAGLALAVGVAYAVRPALEALVPEVPLAYTATSLVRLAVTAAAVGALGSLWPAWRIGRLDPATAFKG